MSQLSHGAPRTDFFIERTDRDSCNAPYCFSARQQHEICLELDGARTYTLGGESYLVNAGEVLLTVAHDTLCAKSADGALHHRYVMCFDRTFLAAQAAALPDVNLFACFAAETCVLTIPPERLPGVERLLSRLWTWRNDTGATIAALRRTVLTELLLLLSEFSAHAQNNVTPDKTASQLPPVGNQTVCRVQAYVNAHYSEPLTLPQIAATFFISPCYLSHLFKQVTGQSLVNFVTAVRVAATKHLLETTNTKIAAIGAAAGFATTAHFSRVFKTDTGLSPQQYRKQYRATHAHLGAHHT